MCFRVLCAPTYAPTVSTVGSSLQVACRPCLFGSPQLGAIMADSVGQLRQEILEADSKYSSSAGLRLNLQVLRDMGALPDFLHWWEFGKPLAFLKTVPAGEFSNYKSLTDNLDFAEREWDRSEQLGSSLLASGFGPR